MFRLWDRARSGGRRGRDRPAARTDLVAKTSRWTHTCAWDGDELGEMDYVQVSAHERVCELHNPQFQTFLLETSKKMYRAPGQTEE